MCIRDRFRRVRQYLVKRWRLQTELNYQYVEGDVEWNPRNTLRYPFFCCFAGFFAGMFGVGGGIVKGPLMLDMGEAPIETRLLKKRCSVFLVS